MRPVKRTWVTNGVKKSAYQFSYRDLDGIRKRVQKPTLKEANAEADRIRRQLDKARDAGIIIKGDKTLIEAGEDWLKACKVGRNGKPPVENSTYAQYDRHLNIHIKKIWPTLKLIDINPTRANQMRGELLESGLSRAMCRKVWTSVKSIISEAQLRGNIVGNFIQPVHIATDKRADNRVEIPNPKEMKALLADAIARAAHKNQQWREAWRRWSPFVHTVTMTGVRMSEIRGLPWPAVHKDYIDIFQRADQYNVIGPPKSAAGYRQIAITPDLHRMLMAWKKICPKGDHDLVFPNTAGNIESLANFTNRAWNPLQERVWNEVRYSPHALRHFRASVIIAAGWTPKEVQVEMGHSSIKVTFDIYGHLFESVKRRADRASMAQEWLMDA